MNTSGAISHVFRFGTAEFDEARAELRVQGLAVDVQQKPLQLLAMLLAQPGEVVRKEDIYRQLWGDRVTVDNVLANAALKLRTALGPENGQRIATVARQGYRFDGPVERVATGRRLLSRLDLSAGMPVPGRENFVLSEQLGASHQNETWRARQPRTGETRVYKFAVDGERLAALKREATVHRLLREGLGERDDLARVLDWNFESPPFFLECEDGGQSLLAWGDSGALKTLAMPARLGLALQVLDAVAAAHGLGVLHKDLKPGNILIAQGANDGWQIRLTDFGSAGIVDPLRLQALHITAMGMTMSPESGSSDFSGTAYYIAPELHTGAAFTTRSDLFSLGVIVYQLVCGDLRRPMASGWARDVGDPLLAEDLALATDLDPARRMASVAELADRIRRLPQRHAEAESARSAQVEAESARQALARAQARRPWVLASVVLLVAGLAASLWLAQGQLRAREDADQQLALANALNSLLTDDVIAAANPTIAGRANVTVAEAVAVAASSVEKHFASTPPATRARLHLAMQRAFSTITRYPEALAQGQLALKAFEDAGLGASDAAAEARLTMAVDLVQVGRMDEAKAALAEFAPAEASGHLTPVSRARALWARAWISTGQLGLKESTGLLDESARLLDALPQPLSPDAALLRERVDFDLGQTRMMLGDYAKAEQVIRHLIDVQDARYGANHPRPLYTRVALAACLGYEGRNDDAQAMLLAASDGLMRTLGPNDRKTISARDQLAAVVYRKGDYAGAAALWTDVLAGFTRLMGETSSSAVTAESNVGLAWLHAGQAARAEPPLRSALAHARATEADDAPRVQQIRFVLADALLELRRHAEVPALLRDLNPEQLNLAEQERDWPARLDLLQGRLLRQQGQLDAARQALERAAAGIDAHSDSPRFSKVAVAREQATLR